jgi:Na+-transporting NADH:ubiquinone oxidoreductase subunit C
VHSTNYIIRFVLILTAFVAVVLSIMSTGLKPIHDQNEAVYNKKAILTAVASQLDSDLGSLSSEQIQDIFDKQVTQSVVNMDGVAMDEAKMISMGFSNGKAESLDMSREAKKVEADRMLPVFTFTKSDGKKFYIFNVRGKGLWDEIWGNIAIEADLNTIAGVAFDHKAETPGLGAEIKDSKAFQDQFIGKKLYGQDGSMKSVMVRKGGAKDKVYEVDGISGATITSDGVTEMMARGMKYYVPYIASIKK